MFCCHAWLMRHPGFVLLLVDPSADLVEAWREEFAAWPTAVSVHEGGFQDRLGEFEALATAGNSYGQMDGGVDGVIAREFRTVQRAVWDAIGNRHHGYQPVGTATVLATGDARCRWLVYAPTMRVPQRLDYDERDIAVHDAMWAALLAVERHNAKCDQDARISTLACPGFGTGVGRVGPQRAARLMACAYRFWRDDANASISAREHELASDA